MQCACAVLSSVVCPAVPYFSAESHKRHDFKKRKKSFSIENCVWIFSTKLSETFLILRSFERDMIIYVRWSSCKLSVILLRFYWIEFSWQIFEKYWNIKFHENPSSASRVYQFGRTDRQAERERDINRQTDMTHLVFTFRNFANAPNKPLGRAINARRNTYLLLEVT